MTTDLDALVREITACNLRALDRVLSCVKISNDQYVFKAARGSLYARKILRALKIIQLTLPSTTDNVQLQLRKLAL